MFAIIAIGIIGRVRIRQRVLSLSLIHPTHMYGPLPCVRYFSTPRGAGLRIYVFIGGHSRPHQGEDI